MTSTSVLYAVLFLLFGTCILGNHSLDYDGVGPSWGRRRTRPVSNTSLITDVLNEDTDGRQSVKSLVSHFERVGREMKDLRQTSYSHTGLRTLCNVSAVGIPWFKISVRLRPFGFRWFRSSCVTDLEFGDAAYLLREIRKLTRVLDRKRSDIRIATQLGWKDAFLFSTFKYDTFAQNCTLYHVPAFRTQSRWSLYTSMTRYRRSNHTAPRKRPYLEELVSTHNSQSDLFHVPIRIDDYNGLNYTAATVESFWGGSPAPTIFGVIPGYHQKKLEDNPAISATIASSAKWLEQVANSYNPANIAIMAFSCILAFVPISLFCEAKIHVVFFYVLFTDIFACMPLAIKGIELMHFSERFHQAIRTRVYGLDYGLDLGVAEMWVATCSAPSNVHWTGLKFLAFAFGSMVLGVAAELFMMFRMKMRKLRMKIKLRKLQSVDHWWEKTECTICLCRHSITQEGTRGIHATKRSLFRIPSRKVPLYHPEEGWTPK